MGRSSHEERAKINKKANKPSTKSMDLVFQKNDSKELIIKAMMMSSIKGVIVW